jgi:hypothetical protein
LLNEKLIENYQCFNFSFSGGYIREFNAFADYAHKMGSSPKLVIVGVDNFNNQLDREVNVPDFVKTHSKPPNVIRTYLTLDSLEFSYRLLKQDPPHPRYYDREFVGKIFPDAPTYSPELKDRNVGGYSIKAQNSEGRLDTVRSYEKFRERFDSADIIGYVPPISAWRIASKDQEQLTDYLETVYAISRFISPLYDFSIPSDITMNPANTFDGSHYTVEINNLVLDRLNGKSTAFGIRVDEMTKDEYFEAFHLAIKDFLISIEEE